MPSRFKEHFEVHQDIFMNIYDYHKPTDGFMDQKNYFNCCESLTNTIDSYSTASSSIRNNEKCTLKRRNRVKPRRLQENCQETSLTSSDSYSNLFSWCLKQKSKLARLRRCI
jgi:hypothetical protein